MSGHFVQRGACAVFDKFTRAKAALAAGADAVLELPAAFAVQAAEYFALGGVLTAQNAGCTHLCFGSESGTLAEVEALAQKPSAAFKAHLKEGLPYGRALSEEQLRPNDILGAEYLKAIKKTGAALVPIVLPRNTAFASAHALRKALASGGDISQMYPCKNTPLFWEAFFPVVKYRLFSMDSVELSHICGVSEGLEYKIKKEVLAADSMNDLILRVKSKRYAYARISRILCCALLNITKETLSSLLLSPPKARLLGVKDTQLLSLLKNYYISPTTIQDEATARAAAIDQYATQVYSLFSSLSGTEDFTLPLLKM